MTRSYARPWEKFYGKAKKKIRKCLKCEKEFETTVNFICPRCTNVNRFYDGIFTGRNQDGIYW